MRNKKILLLGPALSAISGVSTHLNQLLSSSLVDKYRLVHFQVGSEGRDEKALAKLWRLLVSPFALAGKIVISAPDIVHLNTSLEPKSFWRDTIYLMVAKLLRKRVVYQVHGGELPQQFFRNQKLLTVFLRWLLSLPDAVVLLAEVEREAYQNFSKSGRVLVIPNAVDLDAYPARQGKIFESEAIKLGYIGRLAHNKGIFEAVEALGILRKWGIVNINLTIAGLGPAKVDLHKKVKSLGLEEQVFFAGALFGKSKDTFWQQTDIFVFPTFHREGLPYTVLESLASGTPMVTTRVGGIADVMKDGVQGIFVELHDPVAVATAIKTMVGDRNVLRKMSAECINRARGFYGIDRLARQFSELYKALLS